VEKPHKNYNRTNVKGDIEMTTKQEIEKTIVSLNILTRSDKWIIDNITSEQMVSMAKNRIEIYKDMINNLEEIKDRICAEEEGTK